MGGIIVAQSGTKLSIETVNNLRVTLELFLRQKLAFAAEINGACVTINLIDHSTVSYGALSYNPEYCLQLISKFVIDSPKLNTYFRFMVEMAGHRGFIDDRLTSGFIALEVLFPDDSLHKNKVSRALGISETTAELIVELRNRMFHHGESISEAIESIHAKKRVHGRSPLNPVLNQLVGQRNVSFVLYSAFADLMFTYFAESIGLENESLNSKSAIDLRDDDWFNNIPKTNI